MDDEVMKIVRVFKINHLLFLEARATRRLMLVSYSSLTSSSFALSRSLSVGITSFSVLNMSSYSMPRIPDRKNVNYQAKIPSLVCSTN